MFDYHFDRLITPSAIKVLYLVVLVLLGITGLGLAIGLILDFRGEGQPFLVLGLIAGIAAATTFIGFLLRLWCESIIVRFEIADTLKEVRDLLEPGSENPQSV